MFFANNYKVFEFDDNYSFLKTEEKLGDNISYLTLGGSRAYGTNLPTSDIDIRGFYFDNPREVISLKKDFKEEFEDKNTDTVIYSFRKFLTLLAECNPNIIEMLGTRDEEVLFLTDEALWLRENFELFLSKRAYATFVGYATAQLRRLENALARDSYPQAEKEEHILKSLEAEMLQAKNVFAKFGKNEFSLYTDTSHKEDFEKEIFVDCNLSHVPLRDFLIINSSFNNMVRNYGKLNKRNNKKDEPHLRKHAMHLIRLYLMGIDIIENHRIVTYRPEHDLLMAIRNGDMSFDEVFQLQKELDKKLKTAFEKCSLPDKPDMKKIDEFYYNVLSKRI